MKPLQRICMAGLIALLMFHKIYLQQEQFERMLLQWKHAQTQLFLQNICRKGIITVEEYSEFYSKISLLSDVKVCVEEYQREWDNLGRTVYYLFSWEEIQEQLFTKGSYLLHPGSVIKIEIFECHPEVQRKQVYYDMCYERN